MQQQLTRSTPTHLALSLLGATLTTCAIAGEPAAAPSPAPFQKPAWLTDLSLGVKEGYDDNLLLVSGEAAPRQHSWFTTVSPKLGVNAAPLLGDQHTLQVLSLGYAPDFVLYQHEPTEPFGSTESYNAHRTAETLKGKTGAFSFSVDNSLNYVDGSSESPTYAGNDKFRNSFASGTVRERRLQVQDRAKVVLQYDWQKFFVRPTASLLDYDMMTTFRTNSGYQNYPDRADVNGGVDGGYRVTQDLALTLGYRYGHQYQQMLPKNIDPFQFASDCDYQRVLFGLEGKPCKGVTLGFQVGPDFRNYAATAAVIDHHPVKFYGEEAVAAELTERDTLSLKCRQWEFVSYSGRLPIYDTSYELTYRRKLGQHFLAELGGRLAEVDFTGGSDPKGNNHRDDREYTISAGLTYNLNALFGVNVSYSHDFGRSVLDNPPGGAQFRSFDRDLILLGALVKF